MAVLSDPNRVQCVADVQDEATRSQRTWPAVTKADLRAAVNALDDFLDANAAAINNAIPQPARGELNAKQKALLVAHIALRRAGVL